MKKVRRMLIACLIVTMTVMTAVACNIKQNGNENTLEPGSSDFDTESVLPLETEGKGTENVTTDKDTSDTEDTGDETSEEETTTDNENSDSTSNNQETTDKPQETTDKPQETTEENNIVTEEDTTETESITLVTETAGENKKPWDLINDQVLTPTNSGYSELDGLVEGYMRRFKEDGFINDEMTNYQRLRGIYVWFIQKISYNRGMNVDAGKFSTSDPETTPEEVLWATDLFNTGQGCCYNYSAAFMYIMRYLGYDAHLVSGQVGKYGGGTTPHCWVYANLDGKPYTFDPDVDSNYYWRDLKEGKEEPRTDVLFCQPMDEMNFFYTPEKFHDI